MKIPVKMKIKLLALFLLISSFAYSQMDGYHFKRSLQGISESWHTLTLQNEIYSKIRPDLADVRIFGITAKKDTIEAAYRWKRPSGPYEKKITSFKIINQSFTKGGTFYTLELPNVEPINEISLDFSNDNYDWRINLEGSNEQVTWFTLLSNYRILALNNDEVKAFTFSKLKFPNAKYKYYRVFINSQTNTTLQSAAISFNDTEDGVLRNYQIKNQSISQNRKLQQTIVSVDLASALPVHAIKINISDSFDYYRMVQFQYVSDSIKLKNGYEYLYEDLPSGILTSFGTNEFKTDRVLAKKFKMIIQNFNNPPLPIKDVELKGFPDQLEIRFLKKADYYLVYGNKLAEKPRFDLTYFAEKIPKNTSKLHLGKEMRIAPRAEAHQQPLFQNKLWLYILMGFIILLLGGFTLQMMNTKE